MMVQFNIFLRNKYDSNIQYLDNFSDGKKKQFFKHPKKIKFDTP